MPERVDDELSEYPAFDVRDSQRIRIPRRWAVWRNGSRLRHLKLEISLIRVVGDLPRCQGTRLRRILGLQRAREEQCGCRDERSAENRESRDAPRGRMHGANPPFEV